MAGNQGKCCGCLCSRSWGVYLVFFWISLAFFMVFTEMNHYGDVAKPMMIPILIVIGLMALISGSVFFVPGCNTASGRFLVFFWWFAMITISWNVYWWYILFNGNPERNACNWECDLTTSGDTTAYDACVNEQFKQKFIPGIPFFLMDLWISFELYCWQRDAKADV